MMNDKGKTPVYDQNCPNCKKFHIYYYLWRVLSKFFKNNLYNFADFIQIFGRLQQIINPHAHMNAISTELQDNSNKPVDDIKSNLSKDLLGGGDQELSQKDKSATKSNNVVQILTKVMPEDSADSDYSNMAENQKVKQKKSLFGSLIKRKKNKRENRHLRLNQDEETVSSELDFGQKCLLTESEPSSGYREKNTNFLTKLIKGSRSLSNQNLRRLNPRCADNSFFCENMPEDSADNKNYFYHTLTSTTYTPNCNLKLINGITELQDILQNLNTCEEHMILILKKYVSDTNFEKQLMQTSLDYFGTQQQCKCQATALSNGMWLQQLEISKMQEKSLQKKLHFLVKQNRVLQADVENLCRHYERLADKSNLYPKRFLQMRSFGKTYAKHLIDNNRKLQGKVKALTDVIESFESELNKLQEQNENLEADKRNLKSQMYHIEAHLQKTVSSYEIEIASVNFQYNNQAQLIKETEQSSRFLIQDLNSFERQVKELSISLKWPKLQYQESSLTELMYHIRACVEEIVTGLMSAYANISAQLKDFNKLRDTNARLQEHLQKSTCELNTLSKKLEKNCQSTNNEISYSSNFDGQELTEVKAKLEIANEKNKILQQELDRKKTALDDSCESVNSLSAEKSSLGSQIEEFVKVVSHCGVGDVPTHFKTSNEKLDYFKTQYIKAVTDNKYMHEKCEKLFDENQNLLENQQLISHEIEVMQEGLNAFGTENDLIKKQLNSERQTVASLQNERIKYLEEKNILRAIFQQLKSEISRIQHLEGTVSDMSKENNRLALIAEFNKQLGEQLKSEAEMKDNTILELRQSLDNLSHLQMDNDRERMSLCAQLSEVSSVKERLSDCLEQEVKKCSELDESKKKIENSTKSQLKIFEEMQKNERTALKELLRDFKGIVKQRDALVKLQEHSKKQKNQLESEYKELKKQYDTTMVILNDKELEVRTVCEKLKEQEILIRKWEEKNASNNAKYEKAVRKLDKLIGDLRRDKGELDESNRYLQVTLQKIHNELNHARKAEKEASTQFAAKSAEYAALESELTTYKNDCQQLNQDNGKLKVEVDFLRQINEKQNNDLQSTVSQSSTKDTMYQETINTMLGKQFEIERLKTIVGEREDKIKHMELDHGFLKKQNEDLNKILCGYEDQIVSMGDLEKSKRNLEKELDGLKVLQESTQRELEKYKLDCEKLSVELDKVQADYDNDKHYYKSQTEELILECTTRKSNIEQEIGSISCHLEEVNYSLNQEKNRYDELFRAHEELQRKYIQVKDGLSSEISAHKDTCRRILNLEDLLKNVEIERDNLQREIHLVMVALNDEKDSYACLSQENERINAVLEQGRQQYGAIVSKCILLESQLQDAKHQVDDQSKIKDCSINQTISLLDEKNREIETSKETIESLQSEIDENQRIILDLKEDIFKLQQEVTNMEFKNCELTLQIHETQGKLDTERILYKELKQENEKIVERLSKFEEAIEEELMATSDTNDEYY